MPPKRDNTIASSDNLQQNTTTATTATTNVTTDVEKHSINTMSPATTATITTRMSSIVGSGSSVAAAAVTSTDSAEQRRQLFIANSKLCRLVQKCPWMYDRTHAHYGKQQILDKSWAKIAKDCNDSVASCKERWRNIRAAFARSINIYKTHGGPNRVKPYYLHDELTFLVKPMLEGRERFKLGGAESPDEHNNGENDENDVNDDDGEENGAGEEDHKDNDLNGNAEHPMTVETADKISEDIDDDIEEKHEVSEHDDDDDEDHQQQQVLDIGCTTTGKDRTASRLEQEVELNESDCEAELNFTDQIVNSMFVSHHEPATIICEATNSNDNEVTSRISIAKHKRQYPSDGENAFSSVAKRTKNYDNSSLTRPLPAPIPMTRAVLRPSPMDADARFLETLLPEMRAMNTRQKIIFKRKIYQSLEEVFDASNDFPVADFSAPPKISPTINCFAAGGADGRGVGGGGGGGGAAAAPIGNCSNVAKTIISDLARMNESDLLKVNAFVQVNLRQQHRQLLQSQQQEQPQNSAMKIQAPKASQANQQQRRHGITSTTTVSNSKVIAATTPLHNHNLRNHTPTTRSKSSQNKTTALLPLLPMNIKDEIDDVDIV